MTWRTHNAGRPAVEVGGLGDVPAYRPARRGIERRTRAAENYTMVMFTAGHLTATGKSLDKCLGVTADQPNKSNSDLPFWYYYYLLTLTLATKQHAIVSTQLSTVTCTTYQEKFYYFMLSLYPRLCYDHAFFPVILLAVFYHFACVVLRVQCQL